MLVLVKETKKDMGSSQAAGPFARVVVELSGLRRDLGYFCDRG